MRQHEGLGGALGSACASAAIATNGPRRSEGRMIRKGKQGPMRQETIWALKQRVREMLLERKMWSERAMADAPIRALIERLRPVSSDIPLIRMGGAHDGGYLVPDDLDGIAACISPGVSDECSFDTDAATRGMDVYMADASVDGPPTDNPHFHFSRLFFDTYNSDTTVTLDDYCAPIAPGSDLLLEMDIEGAEYRVLQSTSDALMQRFRVMVIEFHALNSLFTPFGFDQIASVFDKLLRTHTVVHIHPNNAGPAFAKGDIGIPPYLEFTFHRRDRATFEKRPLTFPHPLDVANDARVADVVLPEIWQPR